MPILSGSKISYIWTQHDDISDKESSHNISDLYDNHTDISLEGGESFAQLVNWTIAINPGVERNSRQYCL